MSSNDHKLIHLAQVLAAMPEPARLLVVRRILPSGYVVVPRQPGVAIQEAFHATARRMHEGLKAKLVFEASTLVPCWHAMMERAEREVARASTLAP
jgi:threonine dehydrogenase-like Zn-dependent dehydrogenase